MITGAAGGRGGAALGNHLANRKEQGVGARPGESRGLVAETTESRIAELTSIASRAKTTKPLYHVFARPPEGAEWKEQDYKKFWTAFEKEFGLEKQPFAEAIHDNDGHQHRVHSLVKRDGTTIRMSQDFARREKLERVAEFDRGERFVVGAHNKAVIRALETERPDVAEAMKVAGMDKAPRPIAVLSTQDRNQQNRTKVQKVDVAAAVSSAWHHSDNGIAFQAALAEQGLRLAKGDKCPVIVDGSGNTHSVRRLLSMAAKSGGGEAPKEKDVLSRLDGLDLPTVAEARQQPVPEIRHQQPVPVQPVPPSPAQPVISSRDGTPGPAVTQAAVSVPASTAGADTVPSRDGRTYSLPSPPSAGGGGHSPITASASGGSGASLSDVGDGPGEPPAHNATPEEKARYLARLAAYEERKASAWAAWVSSQTGKASGGNHGSVQNEASAAPAVSTGIKATIGTSATDTGKQWHHAADGGGGEAAGRHDTENPHEHRGSVVHACGPDSAAAIGGAVADIGNPELSDGGVGKSAQAGAAARTHIEGLAAARRLENGLASQPDAMTALRRARVELNPEWRQRRDVHERIRDDRAEIARVLRTHPYPDPADRDPVARANAYAGKLSDGFRARKEAVDAAALAAQAAFEQRSFATRMLAAVGVATPEQHRVEDMMHRAGELADTAQRRRPTNEDYKFARADGAAHAYAARQAVQDWENRPDVAQAMQNRRLNGLVTAAVESGDKQVIAAMTAGDPAAARAIMLAREQHEERQRQLLEEARNGPDGPSGPSGPKRR